MNEIRATPVSLARKLPNPSGQFQASKEANVPYLVISGVRDKTVDVGLAYIDAYLHCMDLPC